MKRFSEEFKNKAAELDGIRCADDVIIHLLGERATTVDEALFIQQTNVKYFGVSDSEELLGNFAEIVTGESYNGRRNFIRFNLDEAFREYKNNGWEDIMADISNQISYSGTIEDSATKVLDSLDRYEDIKDRLIFRPLNFKRNEALLKGHVYRKLGDLAIVLYAVVFDDEEHECLNTIKVPEVVAYTWNKTEAEIFEEVMQNTMRFAPARIYTNILKTDSTPDSESDILGSKFEMKHLEKNVIPLVTTTRKTNGAIAMFYPGVKEKISEMFGSNLYVAFTSIHEAMVHNSDSISADSIRRHVQATNRAFGPAETLSDEVYYFDSTTGLFTVVEA